MEKKRIAIVNSIRPMAGAGDGVTEYAYQMYLQLKSKNKVDLVYAIERARKNDATGLLKVNSILSLKAKVAGMKDYDIFHVVNQEVGFAAKSIRDSNCDNKIVTTIHDMARFESNLHGGLLQKVYNEIVKKNIQQAVENSNFLIFDSAQTMKAVKERFKVKHAAVVNIGIDSRFSVKIKKKNRKDFVVGYIGSFARHKNANMIFETATHLNRSNIKFVIYGIGAEYKNLAKFAHDNNLKNLKMMGFAPEESKVQIYDGFDVFVFPSMYEGFGLPILEAQARGLPVIVNKCGKIPSEVKRYCIQADNSTDMARVIEKLRIEGYDENRRSRAMEYARSFTWEKCATNTLKIYDQILSR